MKLTEFINESEKSANSYNFTTKTGILIWLDHNQIPGNVNDNLEIVGGVVKIRNSYGMINHGHVPAKSGKMTREVFIPVKFKSALYFSARSCFLTSMKNFPDKIDGGCSAQNNRLLNCIGGPRTVGGSFNVLDNRLRNTTGFPEKIGTDLLFNSNDTIHNLKNIHHDIKEIGAVTTVPGSIESHILGLLLVGGNGEVMYDPILSRGKLATETIVKRHQAFKILSRHRMNDKDVLECQEELISSGYKEFAKL